MDRLDVDNNALPKLTATVPSGDVPSRNCTVPDTVDGDTVAVNVTHCPLADGFRPDFSVVVVLAFDTVCTTVDDVLPV
jgi:hypothetical protein